MARISGAKAVVKVLEEESIRHVFHLPGSQIIEILDEIYRSPIRAVMTRHEQGAAFMADGYARALRSPGVCMSTVGPGAMNLVSGIAASFKAQVPVIAITGIHDRKILERDSFHEIDQAEVFRPITKWSGYVQLPEKVPEVMRKAFRIALSGRRGPVHIAIPTDVAEGLFDYEPAEPRNYRTAIPPACPKELLDKMLRLVEQARFPVILAGGELLWSGAESELADLAECLQVPVATTRNHPDAYPLSRPLAVGMIGKGKGEAGSIAIKQADLILAMGVKFDYQSTRYSHDIIPKSAKIIHVAMDAEEVGRTYPVEIGVVCDAAMVIKELLARVQERGICHGLKQAVLDIQAEARSKREAEIEMDAHPPKPQAICKVLRQLLPAQTIVALDGGNFAKHVRRHFDVLERGTVHYTDDFGAVGASFPMALGIKVACPERPVVCLNGDGAFLLNSQELETAVRERINVLVVVFNDYGFGNVRAYQKQRFEGRYMCDHDNPPFGEMARLFKAGGAQVKNLGELREAVTAGLKANVPYVIDAAMCKDELEKPGFVERSTP